MDWFWDVCDAIYGFMEETGFYGLMDKALPYVIGFILGMLAEIGIEWWGSGLRFVPFMKSCMLVDETVDESDPCKEGDDTQNA